MEPLTDADIIGRSLEQPPMFAEIFERHFDAVRGYLAKRVGAEVAGDLTAEVFLIAFEKRRRYDQDRSAARPWLFGIATNVVRRHWRQERQRLGALAKFEPHGVQEGGVEALAARVDAAATAREVAAAVAALDRGDRDVLLLVAWADLSYAEVAEALVIPVGTVRSRLHRARHEIRHRLAGSAAATTVISEFPTWQSIADPRLAGDSIRHQIAEVVAGAKAGNAVPVEQLVQAACPSG
jgi:RNA polymerase sigma-70 factor (ECF subfamily)